MAYRIGRFMLDQVETDGLEGFDPSKGFRAINSLAKAIWDYIVSGVDYARDESCKMPWHDAQRRATMMGRSLDLFLGDGFISADRIVPLAHGRLAILTRQVSPSNVVIWNPMTNNVEENIEIGVDDGLPALHCAVDAVIITRGYRRVPRRRGSA